VSEFVRGKRFDAGFVPPVPQRQPREVTPEEKGQHAAGISSNLDRAHQAVTASLESLARAHPTRAVVGFAKARPAAESSVARLRDLAPGAKEYASASTDPIVRAKLEQATALTEVAARNLDAAPAAPEPVAPTLEAEAALMAALPPIEMHGPVRGVFETARQHTRSVLQRMRFSDFAVLERILREFPTHEITVRFGKFRRETREELLAVLKDPKTRVRARELEARMPKLVPPPAAFADAHTAPTLIAPPRAFAPGQHASSAATVDERRPPQKLPDRVRGDLEQATGRSLDHVRVHDGPDGAAVAAQHGARAVAIGSHIHMGEGQHDPVSPAGRELLAHEVAHVVQADVHAEPATAAAKRDGEATENAAEREADDFAARFRADGAAAKWSPRVGVTGQTPLRAAPAGQTSSRANEPVPIVRVDQQATTKPNIRDWVSADHYLSLWATQLLDVVVKNAGPVPPHPHARLRWAVPGAIVDQLGIWMQMERERFGSDDRALLVRLFYPMDLYAIVDTYRDLRPREGDSPVGTSSWQTAIGDTVAAEARPRLHEAIRRAGQRYVTAADALHARGVRDEQDIKQRLVVHNAVLSHSPLEHVVLMVMRDPQMIAYTPPTAKAPREHAPNELVPLLITCMGESDPTLWNVLRVDTPGATAPQLAAVLFAAASNGNDPVAHTYNADLITVAAPYFILPPAWAATIPRLGGGRGPAAFEPEDAKRQRELAHDNPPAAKRAAARQAPDPRTVLAESALVDEIALAQDAVVTRQVDGKPGSEQMMLTEEATKLIARGFGQLEYLRDVLTPWALAEALEPARAFLARAKDKTTRSLVLNASWSHLLEHHGGLLSQISEQVAGFVKEVGAPAGGGDPATPIGRVLATYARAAGASHLVGAGASLFAEAQQARRGVMLATVELAIQSAGAAVAQERGVEDETRRVDGAALELDDHQRDMKLRAAEMRNALVQGKTPDAGAAEELIFEAEENRLIATVSSLKVQLEAFKSAADKGALGFLPGVVEGTEHLNMRRDAPFLAEELAQIHAYLADGHKIIYASRDPKNAADPSLPDVTTRKRQNLQKYVRGAHQKLETLKKEARIEEFLKRADAVLADQRWRITIAEAAALIGIGLVTGGAASFVGGLVRGALMLDLGADAAALVATAKNARSLGATAELVAEAASTMRTARVASVAAEVVTDAALSGVAQHAVTGGDTAIGENIVANAVTRFALHPLSRITAGLGEVDQKALSAWARVGHGTKLVLAHGVQLSAEMITSTAIGYAVHRVAAMARGETPTDEMVDSWLLQGASFAVGRYLNGRLGHRMQQLDKLGQRAGSLRKRTARLEQRAAQLERTGSPDEALDVLMEHHRILDAEVELIGQLERDGALRAHEADAMRADTSADANVMKSQAFVAVQARAVGLEPVVAEAGRWAGDAEQIANMIFKGRALGLDVRIVEVGNQTKKWRVQYGDEMLEVTERGTKPVVGGEKNGGRGGRQVAVHEDVRAQLHAKAVQELANIRISVAPTENASRGYLVTREDGRRMVELFSDMEGLQTIEYKNGVIVRAPDRGEWYFEFRDDAHASPQGKTPPTRITGTQSTATEAKSSGGRTIDASFGLPDPNVATVEIYGYSGVRHIEGRKVADMSNEKRTKLLKDTNLDDPLLLAGHVAISFDGGKTVYGFTPKPDDSIDVETTIQMLRDGKVFPGQVRLDGDHYVKAATKLAEEGWDTHLTRVVVTFDPNEAPAIRERTLKEKAANENDQHLHNYIFPKKGQMPSELTANCATWLRFVGVPIPEPTGRMSEYMPALKQWEAADAPIAAHSKDRLQ
jgi:hypothetical protein